MPVRKPRSKNQQSAIRNPQSLVAVIMGSKSDWETMRAASEILNQFGVTHERSCASFALHRKRKLPRQSGIKVDSFVCGDYSFMMWNMNAGMPTTMQTTLRTTPRVEYCAD